MAKKTAKEKFGKPITTFSVKLPQEVEKLEHVVAEQYVKKMDLGLTAYLAKPQNVVEFENPNATKYFERQLAILEQAPRYHAKRIAAKNPPIDVAEMREALEKELHDNGMKDVYIVCKYIIIEIDGQDYHFKYHRPSKALILHKINQDLVGSMKQRKRDELLAGELSFCAPSRCVIRYTREVICDREMNLPQEVEESGSS